MRDHSILKASTVIEYEIIGERNIQTICLALSPFLSVVNTFFLIYRNCKLLHLCYLMSSICNLYTFICILFFFSDTSVKLMYVRI